MRELLSLEKGLGSEERPHTEGGTQHRTPPAHSQTLLFPSLSPNLASLPENRFVFCQPLGVTSWEHFEEFQIKGFL